MRNSANWNGRPACAPPPACVRLSARSRAWPRPPGAPLGLCASHAPASDYLPVAWGAGRMQDTSRSKDRGCLRATQGGGRQAPCIVCQQFGTPVAPAATRTASMTAPR